MKRRDLISLAVVICLSSLRLSGVASEEDLYKVLGVDRRASLPEIKRAYKQLAKEWHPDKNNHPSANEKFMKINEAYETLSDDDRRRDYDQYGTTTAQAGNRHQEGYDGHPFGGGFGSFQFGNMRFNFGGNERSDKLRTTLRAYENSILPESGVKPFLIYAYTDFCYQCMHVQPIWQQMVGDLEKIGMGAATLNANMDMSLSHRLRLSSVPAVTAVVSGKVRYFSKQFTVANLREFVRSILPSEVVIEVSESKLAEFLDGWKSDNHVRMLMIDSRKQSCLRYLLAAFAFRDRVTAGYCNIAGLSPAVLSKYQISRGQENLLIFKEDSENPVAHLSMQTISRSTMDEIIESNKYLVLPRLSNQATFNHICPQHSAVRNKKLCVLLLTRDVLAHDAYRDSFRSFVRHRLDTTDSSSDRLSFGYVCEETQSAFVTSVTLGQGVTNDTLGTLKVVVVWRKESSRLQLDYLEDGWYSTSHTESSRESCQHKLNQLIDWRLNSGDVLPFNVELRQELNDEYRDRLAVRVGQALSDIYDWIWDKLSSIDDIAWVTVVGTMVTVVVIGFFVCNFGLEAGPARPNRRGAPGHRAAPEPANQPAHAAGQVARPGEQSVNIYEMKLDTYSSLILHGSPGVLVIIVLVDDSNKNYLLQQFASIALPYSRMRNPVLQYAFLSVDVHLRWYRRLLEATPELSHQQNFSNINARKCVGTVLACNGAKSYFSLFSGRPQMGRDGGFLGLEDHDDDDDDDVGVFNGLAPWLDNLCDGCITRYKVNAWPAF